MKKTILLVTSLLAAISLMASGVALAASVSFAPAQNYEAGYWPFSTINVDINNDGILDLVTNDLSVLLGNSDGTFQTPAKSIQDPTFNSIQDVASADFNGDGVADLAVPNAGSTNISVLLNDKDNPGSFAPATTYTAGTTPISITSADYNGDGKADLAVANNAGGQAGTGDVSVLLGNGNGTFAQAVNYGAGSVKYPGAGSITSADLNKDGKPDLVVANNNVGQTGGPNDVTVLLNDGTGQFNVNNYPAGTNPGTETIGDFNNDGNLDIAVANAGIQWMTDTTGNVSVLLGNGDGSFKAPVNYATTSNPGSITNSDLDGDGKLDLIVSNYGGGSGDTVSVFSGNGDGTFQTTPQNFSGVGPGPLGVTKGDFNKDAKPDLVVTNHSPPFGISVLRNTTTAPTTPTTSGNASGGMQTASGSGNASSGLAKAAAHSPR